MQYQSPHSFHIPVMGLAFTIDAPVKVAKYGISSVVSIIEDELVEKMRGVICGKEGLSYEEITSEDIDSRAKRITAYLNVLENVVENKTKRLSSEDFETGHDINLYFEMLPDSSVAKKMYRSLQTKSGDERAELEAKLRRLIKPGKIDVNIMTKLDRTTYDKDNNPLPVEYCDAMAALRGFAKSNLSSSIVFSAGLNPRLYSYCEQFPDFFPDENGFIKKKIILKVSDYRSALIQGKYLAKKGLWISEFRIESGINCGGHAFISNGILLGPILEEFKNKREELYETLYAEVSNTLKQANREPFHGKPRMRITAQGGIGTSDENDFLLQFYHLDGTGWGSPFLLVPEVTNVDEDTLHKLAVAKKEDYFLSNASPLGVPFNNFRSSSGEIQRKIRIEKNRPGSPCYKKYLSSNTEFTEIPICTSSRQYLKLKVDQLKLEMTDPDKLQKEIDFLGEKDCLCEGLGAPALLVNNAPVAHGLTAVTICPGPNLAYFSGIFSLKQMVDHIYGRLNLLNHLNRPSLFVNELQLYVDFINKEFQECMDNLTAKKLSYFESFKKNLIDGIRYYEELFPRLPFMDGDNCRYNLDLLQSIEESLNQIFLPLTIQAV